VLAGELGAVVVLLCVARQVLLSSVLRGAAGIIAGEHVSSFRNDFECSREIPLEMATFCLIFQDYKSLPVGWAKEPVG
jgi:hypothetical protein